MIPRYRILYHQKRKGDPLFLFCSLLAFLMVCQHWTLGVSSTTNIPGLCQGKCLCVEAEQAIDCNPIDRIPVVPTNIKPVFIRLIIQHAAFRKPILQPVNMTGLEHLRHMKIIYSGITNIEPYTFMRMKSLETLDLSTNKLRRIEPFAFAGLRLDSLNLQDNPGIELHQDVFNQLHVKEINLRNNALRVLHSSTFLNTGVEKLYLFQNDIRSVDYGFSDLFGVPAGSSLNCFNKILDLTMNPLVCSCDLKWLAESLQHSLQCPGTKDVHVTCASPERLRGHPLHKMTEEDLGCPRLAIREILLELTPFRAQLGCVAEGNPSAEVYLSHMEAGQLRQYQGESTLNQKVASTFSEGTSASKWPVVSSSVFHPTRVGVSMNISLETLSSEQQEFKCSALSDLRRQERAEVIIHIKAPQWLNSLKGTTIHTPGLVLRKSSDLAPQLSDNGDLGSSYPNVLSSYTSSWSNSFLFQKHFDLLELLTAICVTFIITLLLMLFLSRYLFRNGAHRMWLRHRCVADKVMSSPPHPTSVGSYWSPASGMSAYSGTDSHEYDIPRTIEAAALTGYHPVPMYPSHEMEFLDFKTHRKVHVNNMATS